MFMRGDIQLCYDNEMKEAEFWENRGGIHFELANTMTFPYDRIQNQAAAEASYEKAARHRDEAEYWKSRLEEEERCVQV